VGAVSSSALSEVTAGAAVAAVVLGAGTFDAPTTANGVPAAAADVDADVDDTETDDTPTMAIPDAVALEALELSVAVEDADAVGAGTDDRPSTTIPPAAAVDATDAVVDDDEEAVDDESSEDEAEVVAATAEAVVEDEDDESLVVEEDDESVELDEEFCIVTVHVFTSCTAAFPLVSVTGVSTTTQVSVSRPRGVLVVWTVVTDVGWPVAFCRALSGRALTGTERSRR